MLYQNRQVVLSQLSPFSGQYLVKLNRSVVRPESFAAVARYKAQKSDERAASSFQLPSQTGRRAAPTASLQSKTEGASAWELGSGLIDHSQNMAAAAAMQIAEK
jgi:hypothetical protein